MIAEKVVQLRLFNQPIKARIVTLTAELAEKKLMRDWWADDCLKHPIEPRPIDMFWDWNSYQVNYEGRILSAEKVAVVTGSGAGLEVQGAMVISAGMRKLVCKGLIWNLSCTKE
jgi:hypothetical protein